MTGKFYKFKFKLTDPKETWVNSDFIASLFVSTGEIDDGSGHAHLGVTLDFSYDPGAAVDGFMLRDDVTRVLS